MPNEDNTQQMSNSNSQVIAAIRSLEDRVANVEQIIVARLNTTRPLDQQILTRLDELVTTMAAMRVDYERFREETDENFRKIIERQDILNNDNLDLRLEYRRQSKRISRLEEAHTK